MRKIIIFLALVLGIEVKAQIVGGYLPINSSKSATVGALRVNGALTATGVVTGGSFVTAGTSSVGSTQTVTGLATFGSSVTVAGSETVTGQLTAQSNTNLLGQATIQTQSTVTSMMPSTSGTLSNLADAYFTITFNHTASSPADAAVNYFGNGTSFSSNALYGQCLIPFNCVLYAWSYSSAMSAGTAETGTISIRKNNTTDLELNTAISYSSSIQTYTATGLSTQYSTGDLINLKETYPTWATNPTSVTEGITLYFYRRQ